MKAFAILGYGAGPTPLIAGIDMGQAKDIGYAKDICQALALKHFGQWFGYSYPWIEAGEREIRLSNPIRCTTETDER